MKVVSSFWLDWEFLTMVWPTTWKWSIWMILEISAKIWNLFPPKMKRQYLDYLDKTELSFVVCCLLLFTGFFFVCLFIVICYCLLLFGCLLLLVVKFVLTPNPDPESWPCVLTLNPGLESWPWILNLNPDSESWP